jgi:hypothetical protein
MNCGAFPANDVRLAAWACRLCPGLAVSGAFFGLYKKPRDAVAYRPCALRTYAALFDRMLSGEATLSAARALRFWADANERRRSAIREIVAEDQTRQTIATVGDQTVG